ncbi:hypothetical protein M5689_000857 [Euphorbia peplus]|nr:hypothetical protein M5689_000857 [Euphorbia peplus]
MGESSGSTIYQVLGIKSKFEAIPHIPSFVSLKDARHDVDVLNVNSRCAELRLHNEAKTVSLVAEKGIIKFTINHGKEFDSSKC